MPDDLRVFSSATLKGTPSFTLPLDSPTPSQTVIAKLVPMPADQWASDIAVLSNSQVSQYTTEYLNTHSACAVLSLYISVLL